jgi:hypothetical protein
MMMMAVCATMLRSRPLPPVNSATLLPSSMTIARCLISRQDLPQLLQVRRHSVSRGVLALTFTCSICCGLSSVPGQCHCPCYRSCPSTPTRLGWTHWHSFEPWGDDSLRHNWCDYWRWVARNRLYYVGTGTGEIVASTFTAVVRAFSST